MTPRDNVKVRKTLRRPTIIGNGRGGIILKFVEMPVCVCDDQQQSFEGVCQSCGDAIALQDGS